MTDSETLVSININVKQMLTSTYQIAQKVPCKYVILTITNFADQSFHLIDFSFLLRRALEVVIGSNLFLALIQQWIIPSVVNSLLPFSVRVNVNDCYSFLFVTSFCICNWELTMHWLLTVLLLCHLFGHLL